MSVSVNTPEGARELHALDKDKALAEGQQSEVESLSPSNHDRDRLARLGKREMLKRRFGFMSMLGFSCTVMVTWEGVLILFTTGFTNGGPAGLVYQFIIVWIGTLSVFVTLSELASMAPTSGGQYYWVAMLAPKKSKRFLSYITGWLTVIGWQASSASGGYISGTLIQGLISVNNPTYDAKGWQGTLLFWAVIFLAVVINTVVSAALPKIEGLILILHVLGFFAILIPLLYLAPHGSATEVFTVFLNQGNWGTKGLSFWVGISGLVFAFLGADAAVHMSEEIQNAAITVPRSIITSVILNGVLGFGMLMAVLFCLGDIDKITTTPPLQYPFMTIFSESAGFAGGSAMAAIVTVLNICATIAFVASSSRMYWSFARDRGLPSWRFLSKVDPRTSIPMYTVILTTTISCLLGLINIGSSVAFNDVISLTINGLYASYSICSGLLLWRRCTGAIKLPCERRPPYVAGSMLTEQLEWGPWRVPGALGIAINATGFIYTIIILFFSFWPPATPVIASTMNYSSLMTGAVIIFSVIYYFVYAHKVYSGPMVDIDTK